MRYWIATFLLCTACVATSPFSTTPAEIRTWVHPSATPQQTRNDIYECENDSITATPSPLDPNLFSAAQAGSQAKERSNLFRKCMENRGYRWEVQ